ncbi:MAG: hypothetical protein V4654_08775 [Bdellovibrionota bacterium]
MKIFLTATILSLQSLALAATPSEQACADKTQKQNEMQLITAKLSRSEQLGMSTEKEMQAMALARQELEKAEEVCPITKDEACVVRAQKKKEYDSLIGMISRNPTIDMDRALTKLKAVSKVYKKAKSICPQ